MAFFQKLWRLLQRIVPFGLLVRQKPRHFREMFKILWANRGRWRYGMRILQHGVCDGCSLGPRGLRDDVIPGVHLCLTRLGLMRLNTMGPIPDRALSDISSLRKMSNQELHALGRVPAPLYRRKDDAGFRKISWDQATALVADRLRATDPDRMAFFVSSRGLTNEAYYVTQKLARIAGTPHVDSCARLCHAASSSGLKATIGWAAPTCSLSDIIGTDLLILIGTDLANNQPVTTKYMHYAKERGTKVVVINPFREPALDRYWVPSVASSALWGTKITDEFFPVKPGGDIAFMSGVLKSLDEKGGFDEKFLTEHTTGAEALRVNLHAMEWSAIEADAGLPRAEMERMAEMYKNARTCVLLYSMGLTQYTFGVENVKMVVNWALSRGMIGREKCGIIPIRGHSGVQGTAECGADSDKLPGAVDINEENCARFEAAWGHPIPHRKGLKAAHALDASADGKMDLMFLVGGNFLETLPDPENARQGLSRPKLRIHQDILLNSSALVDAEEVLILPAQTRYESGGTSTSTERRIRYSPAIDDPDGVNVPLAKAEWEIPTLIGRALAPHAFPYENTDDVRAEMGKLMPLYAGIEGLHQEGEFVQWGGARLGQNGFSNMPEKRAILTTIALPKQYADVPTGKFMLTTRRGKQFNSILFAKNDPITGSPGRSDILFAAADLASLGIKEGDPVLLRSDVGEMHAVARIGPCRQHHVQAFWPESNVLLSRRYDPISGEPDYNAIVSVERA